MRYVDLTQNPRQIIPNHEVQQLSEPHMIFLGGLLHIQDMDTQKNLPSFLRKLRSNSPARILMPLDESGEDTGQLENFMDRYGRNEVAPSQFAMDIYATTIKPHIDAANIKTREGRDAVKDKLSQICLVGYSYGTSLIQQIAEIAALEIARKAKTDGFKHTGIIATEICSAIKAINIGPVCKFKSVSSDGHIHMLEADDPQHEESNTIFSQISFLMCDDKIVQRSYGNDLLAKQFNSQTGIEVRNSLSTTTFIDYVGVPYHAAIGIFYFSTGAAFPKIITSYDYMLHDMRTYMNTLEVQGDLSIYPSFAISSILRACSAEMFISHENGKEWLERMRTSYTGEQERCAVVRDFRSLREEFDNVLHRYQKSVLTDAIPMLQAHVADVRHRISNSNQPPTTMPKEPKPGD